jgi:hypothetical protein
MSLLASTAPMRVRVGRIITMGETDIFMPQSEIIFSVRESPEGGYQARALGYSIFTPADSFESFKTMIEAVSGHFADGEKPGVILGLR